MKNGNDEDASAGDLYRWLSWIITVALPLRGIIDDVLTNSLQGLFVAHDAVVEPGLPCKIGIPGGANAFGANHFELSYDGPQRMGQQPRWRHIRQRRGVPPGRLYPITIRVIIPNVPVMLTNAHNPMKMVGHHHPFVQNNIWTYLFGTAPFIGYDVANRGPLHPARYDITKPTYPVFRADRYKIPTGRSVIPAAQPCGFDSVTVFEQGHSIPGEGFLL